MEVSMDEEAAVLLAAADVPQTVAVRQVLE
jgi:hypothetical protein